MSKRTKGRLGESCRSTCLAIATLMVAGQGMVTRARGAEQAARGVQAAAGPIKRPVSRPGSRGRAGGTVPVSAPAGKRDPFKVPPPPRLNGGDEVGGPAPPGVRGLVIGQLKLEGIVREDAGNSMIAVVTGRTDLAYFLRVHDEVYNGAVTRITPDSIHFVQNLPEPGGRVGTREVVLKLDPQGWEAR